MNARFLPAGHSASWSACLLFLFMMAGCTVDPGELVRAHELALDGIFCDHVDYDCVAEPCENVYLYNVPGNPGSTAAARHLTWSGGVSEERLIVAFLPSYTPDAKMRLRTRAIILSASGACNDYGRRHPSVQTLESQRVMPGLSATSSPRLVSITVHWDAWVVWSEKYPGHSDYLAEVDFALVTPTSRTTWKSEGEWGIRPSAAAGWNSSKSTARILVAVEDCRQSRCSEKDIELYSWNPFTHVARWLGEVDDPPGDPDDCQQTYPAVVWNDLIGGWFVIWNESQLCAVDGEWKVFGQFVSWMGGYPTLVPGRHELYSLDEGGEGPDDSVLAANPSGAGWGAHGYLVLPDFGDQRWRYNDASEQYTETDPPGMWSGEYIQTTTVSDGETQLHYEVLVKDWTLGDVPVYRERYTNGLGGDYSVHQRAAVSVYDCDLIDCTVIGSLALGAGEDESVAIFRHGSTIRYTLMNR